MWHQRTIRTIVLCLVLVSCPLLLLCAPANAYSDTLDESDFEPIIGISLGNTNSRVAFCPNGTTHVIPNAQGHKATPNYVAFDESDILVGDEAKARYAEQHYPGTVISGFIKYLGHNFTSMENRTDVAEYRIVDRHGVPKYQIHLESGGVVEYSPTELTALLLQSLKQDAERYLGEEVKQAFVAVPDGFSDIERSALKDAGEIAGLEILRIKHRSREVAFAYDVAERREYVSVLVYHLGGSYAEVSVVEIEDEVYVTFGQSSDTHDNPTVQQFNHKVVEFIVDGLDPFYALDPVEETKKSYELLGEAERVQRSLSSDDNVKIEDRGRSINLPRSKFERIIDDDLNKTLVHIEKALAEADISASQLKAVLLSGGSTNMPIVKNMLEKHLGKPILVGKDFDPEEAAVVGAAKTAYYIRHAGTWVPTHYEFAPLNLGVETMGGFLERIIAQGTMLSAMKAATFTTTKKNQGEAIVRVFEGVRPFTKDGNLLGTLTLNGNPSSAGANVEIEVTLQMDYYGTLTVIALDKQTGRRETISVVTMSDSYDTPQILRMIEDKDTYEADDLIMVEKTKKMIEEGKWEGKDGELKRVYERRTHDEL